MRGPKRILVYNAGPLCPAIGMNQVRVINQLKALSKDHEIDFFFLSGKKKADVQTFSKLKPYCKRIIIIRTVTRSIFYRLLKKLFFTRLLKFISYPEEWFSLSNSITARQIAKEINRNKYDFIISHYWQASGFLRYLTGDAVKFVDTHYLVEENLELYQAGSYNHLEYRGIGSILQKEMTLQNRVFSFADGFIVNSVIQKEILVKKYPEKKTLYVPNGQDLQHFFQSPPLSNENDINFLFYGSLSNQFKEKALKRLLNSIFPSLREKLPEAAMFIMGSNPPGWLIKRAEGNSYLKITGYIEDPCSIFYRCCACILPLESGSGFRGRVVELMAGGVPVIGTSNALKSINIEHGMNGFIADSDEDIVKYSVLMANDHELRQKIVRNGRDLVKTHFSLESTFGRLSEYFLNIRK